MPAPTTPTFDKKSWLLRMRRLSRRAKPDPEGKSAVALIRKIRDKR